MPSADKIRFLSRLAHGLSIVARGEYPAANPGRNDRDRVERLRAINELQHQVTAQLGGLIEDSSRYPDDVFCELLTEQADAAGLAQSLEWAINAASTACTNDLALHRVIVPGQPAA